MRELHARRRNGRAVARAGTARPRATIGSVPTTARYDGFVDWYQKFRPALSEAEVDVLERYLGRGPGRCLDLGCGTGVAIPTLARLGWTVVGVDVSEKMLEPAAILISGNDGSGTSTRRASPRDASCA